MLFMWSSLLWAEDFRPSSRRHQLILAIARRRTYLFRIRGFKFDKFGKVAFKVSSIYNHFFDGPWCTKFNNNPISVVFPSASCSFPTIAHIDSSSRKQDIAGFSKMLVTHSNSQTSVCNMSEIHCYRRIRENRYHDTKKSKSGDPSIRKHRQLDMSVRLLCRFR
jgi:hypothetical protein